MVAKQVKEKKESHAGFQNLNLNLTDQGDCLEVRSHGEFGWHTDTTEGSGLARRLEGETDIMVDLVGEEGGWSHDTMDRIGHISTGIQWFGRWVAAYLYQDHNLGF